MTYLLKKQNFFFLKGKFNQNIAISSAVSFMGVCQNRYTSIQISELIQQIVKKKKS